MSEYLFKSERLGFRNWKAGDVPRMIQISADPQVMEHFPSIATSTQTIAFVEKLKHEFETKGYSYFAVDELDTTTFIGFIGLLDQSYDAPFTPCTDIGWRISKEYWNQGYASEGAECCLEYAFNTLKIKAIKSTAPKTNTKSIHIMKKLGMLKILEFKHPRLNDYPTLEDCVCYELTKEQYDHR